MNKINYILISIFISFSSSITLNAQINESEIAIRFIHSLDYNIYYTKYYETDYHNSDFLPVKIKFENADSIYTILKSKISDYDYKISSYDEADLFYYVPTKKSQSSNLRFFTYNDELSFNQTNSKFDNYSIESAKKIEFKLNELQNKFESYEELTFEKQQYEPFAYLIVSGLSGLFAYDRFKRASNNDFKVINTLLGSTASISAGIFIALEIEGLFSRRKINQKLNELSIEFKSY